MKTIVLTILVVALCAFSISTGSAQEEARAVWRVTSFDINANIDAAQHALNSTAIVNLRNLGRAAGTSFTFRINPKATIKSVTVNGANGTFHSISETRGNLQRVTATLPTAVAPDAAIAISVGYTLPVESNSGLAAISPIGSQFLPLAYWYPIPNSPFTSRAAETAAFRLTVNAPNVLSSGMEKRTAGSSTFEQSLNAQPFFVQGEWDKIDGAGDGKGIAAYLGKGATAQERKQAEAIISLAGAARSFYGSMLGPPPDVPVRVVAVRRGSGFNDAGTLLLDAAAFRRSKIDSASALLISEALARLWIGSQTPVRGEGGGVLSEGLVRYFAILFLEKQFGRNAALAETLRQQLAYSSVAHRDAPLSNSSPLEDTYYIGVGNKGAIVWRLIAQVLGRDVFINTLRTQLQAVDGITLTGLRTALAERGGEAVTTLVDQELDQVTDMDLMIGLPQQRGGEWISALRNLGSIPATVMVTGTTDRGEKISSEGTVPARGFGQATFKTSARIVQVEIDPDKLYPQLDYSNDVVPRVRDANDAIGEATRLLGTQDYPKAESIARELAATAPLMQEARLVLGRALLAQNKLDEADKLFRALLDEPLPTPATVAWANTGLGEIALKRGQAAEAAQRFNGAVRSEGDYAASLAARAGRIRAEAAAGNAPTVDDSVRAFFNQLDQTIVGGRKAELDSRIVPGELVRFMNALAGTPTEVWQTRVLRTEALGPNLVAADVTINAKQLGRETAGSAVMILARTGGAWKLDAIELFEVR